MTNTNIFSLAERQQYYLNMRQLSIAQNVANISTPGYKAIEAKPFREFIRSPQSNLSVTNERHIRNSAESISVNSRVSRADDQFFTSKDSVNIETELIRSGETRRMYDLSTSIYKTFHKMYLSVLKG